jgi:hypothetical protein
MGRWKDSNTWPVKSRSSRVAWRLGINISAPVQYIQIRHNPETYDTLISDMVRGGGVDLELSSVFDDPLVSQIASTIGNRMRGGFLDRILADALNIALAVRITRHFVDPSKIALTPSNGLSRERLQRVQDYIGTSR